MIVFFNVLVESFIDFVPNVCLACVCVLFLYRYVTAYYFFHGLIHVYLNSITFF
jgi:hypothetical protein